MSGCSPGEWAGPLAGLGVPFVLLEDRLCASKPASLYHSPHETVRCDSAEALEMSLDRIHQGVSRGLHAAGLLSYELGYALEPRLAARMPVQRPAPLFWFGLFEPPRRIDSAKLDAAFAVLGPPPPLTGLRPGLNRTGHAERLGRISDLIAAGDVYQVNLTFPMRFEFEGDPLALYAALRAAQPVSHGGVLALDDRTVLSVSPELWVSVWGDQATAQPMKGTIAREVDPEADRAAQRSMAADPKQRAENLMIVDLLRNDLARISEPGTVRVPHLFTVESYPSFHALTSTVTSRLRPGVGLRERITALFPCGSIVGAPKLRASEVIADLESEPRGVYTGAIGAIAPNGDMDFNVAIRTAVIGRDGQGRYGVGGGIVADSRPDDEYDEALLKGRVLSDLALDYQLIETLRWAARGRETSFEGLPGHALSVAPHQVRGDTSPVPLRCAGEEGFGFIRLGLHLDRLAASAEVAGFRFDRLEVEGRLAQLERLWRGSTEDSRVRLTLARAGGVDITHGPVATQPALPLRVMLADHRLDPGDPFLPHKTTRRAAYDVAYARATAKGLDEALFLNRRG